MSTKTSPRRKARQTEKKIVRCDEALALLLDLPAPAPRPTR